MLCTMMTNSGFRKANTKAVHIPKIVRKWVLSGEISKKRGVSMAIQQKCSKHTLQKET